MNPILVCGRKECRQEAKRRNIPIYKYDPFHNRKALSARRRELARGNQF
ncbi:hypothetical protein ES705_31239 [subsurface metagenome]